MSHPLILTSPSIDFFLNIQTSHPTLLDGGDILLVTLNITSTAATSYLNHAFIELPRYLGDLALSTLNCSLNPDFTTFALNHMLLIWTVLQEPSIYCTFSMQLDSLFAIGEILAFSSILEYISLSRNAQTFSLQYQGVLSLPSVSTSLIINSTIPCGNITELTAYQNVDGVYFVTSLQKVEINVNIYMFPQVLSTLRIHLNFTNITVTPRRASIELETGDGIFLWAQDPFSTSLSSDTTCRNNLCTIDVGIIENHAYGSLASVGSEIITILFDLNLPILKDNEIAFIDGHFEYSTIDSTEVIDLEPLYMLKNPLQLEVTSINNSAYLPDAGDVVSISCIIGHGDESFTFTENIAIYIEDLDPFLLFSNDTASINFTDSNSGMVNNFVTINSSDLEDGVLINTPLFYDEVIELQFDVTLSELTQPSMQLTLNITIEYNDTGQLIM